MICPKCQQEIAENTRFCKECGYDVQQAAVASIPTPPMPVVPTPPAPQRFTADMLPAQYRPLSPWAYFGLSLLFSVPIVGFVFLIVFSFNRSNINRRNFARSYWCALLIVAAVMLLFAIIAATTGASLAALLDY